MSQMELSLPPSGIAASLRQRVEAVLAAAILSLWQGLQAMVAAVILSLRRSALRREIAALSDRQLRDAGIDLSLAGRGRAAAVDAAVLRRLQSLS